ncbi:syndecan-2 [Platysternon megacephalum]|uniref:Syndecan-2 n=1 Tax=Platysternon megacephalum TaxID=55544 RepID=A0A4D9E7V4_9SAUR|nr:syndecan-2 [Platysternon megacephalum]
MPAIVQAAAGCEIAPVFLPSASAQGGSRKVNTTWEGLISQLPPALEEFGIDLSTAVRSSCFYWLPGIIRISQWPQRDTKICQMPVGVQGQLLFCYKRKEDAG